MAITQKKIGFVLATVLVAMIVGSALVAQNVSAVTDNSHKNGLKTAVGTGVPGPIKNCILQHLNNPAYYKVGVGQCIQALT
ncbi:MAG: hypothetical protein E6K83_05265 [Thaumarchaeota archaeon]|nr:MAG: hypothetical protein E6K83_05265 [Nitrososphaerota archaeon]